MEKEGVVSRALSAASRRQILRLLADKEMTVKDIATKTNISVSLASRHLTFLTDLGLLSYRIKRPFKYYSLKMKEIKELLLLYDKVAGKL